ncbi:MAG TPA: ThiF family adenylyltransferase [Candidatus Saccharimonadales bacterium]|nr:ThiF family adenylyltransferase [Candidatus Saccharimonadales bacterium]
MSERSVLIVGAGSVGSTIAVELAKAGLAHLTLVDKDAYDVNNSVRHELPLIYAGANKAEAVSFHCRAVNPFSNVVAIPSDAGVGILPPELGKLIAGADLTVDATGSGEITQLLCRTCHEHDRPLLVATLTSSAYGAEVVLGRHEGGCPNCFMLGQGDGVVPTPPSGPASNVTPVGCSQPTFFGAGFEATELAAVATRMAIAGCGGTSYPNLGYDWAVLDFRGDSHWRSGKLERDRQCPYHS